MATALAIHHYGTGDIRDDHGWGCVYRCLQMLVSTLEGQPVPTMTQLLRFFGLWERYARGGSRGPDLWLEPPDAARYLRARCGATPVEWLYLPDADESGSAAMRRCTPRHYRRQRRVLTDSRQLLAVLAAHFEAPRPHPFIIDNGISAYILADYTPGDDRPVHLVDPHVTAAARATRRHTSDFLTDSPLWMLCSAWASAA